MLTLGAYGSGCVQLLWTGNEKPVGSSLGPTGSVVGTTPGQAVPAAHFRLVRYLVAANLGVKALSVSVGGTASYG